MTTRSIDVAGRATLFTCVALYVAAYLTAYIWLVVPIFDYFGLGLPEPLDPVRIVAPIVFALVPVFWLPLRLDRPSVFLLWVQYYIVYIPGCFLAFLSTRPEMSMWRSWTLAAALACGMAILLLAQRLPVVRLPRVSIPAAAYWLVIWGAGLAMFSLVVATLGGNFRLAGLDDIYDVRGAGSELAAGNAAVLYSLNWLNAFVLPLLLAYGLFARRQVAIWLATAGFVFLFGIWGGKASLLAPVFIVLIYLLARQTPERAARILPLALAAIVLSPALVLPLNDLLELAQSWAVQIVNQRTFSSSALLIVQYLEFFSVNPQTSGSHVGPVSAFMPHAYPGDVPRTIGMYQYGGPMTANANFWAADGITGFGLLGIPLVSIVCGLVFWLLDSATRHVLPAFTVVTMGYIGANFADTSLFTTLVTGGLGLVLVALFLVPRNFLFLADSHTDHR